MFTNKHSTHTHIFLFDAASCGCCFFHCKRPTSHITLSLNEFNSIKNILINVCRCLTTEGLQHLHATFFMPSKVIIVDPLNISLTYWFSLALSGNFVGSACGLGVGFAWVQTMGFTHSAKLELQCHECPGWNCYQCYAVVKHCEVLSIYVPEPGKSCNSYRQTSQCLGGCSVPDIKPWH